MIRKSAKKYTVYIERSTDIKPWPHELAAAEFYAKRLANPKMSYLISHVRDTELNQLPLPQERPSGLLFYQM